MAHKPPSTPPDPTPPTEPAPDKRKRRPQNRDHYSYEFPVGRDEPRLRIDIDRIPYALFWALKRAARKHRVSVRGLTLRLWTEWLRGRDV